jgi:hypothetical protein
MATLGQLSRGEIKASSRNKYIGIFADALTAGRGAANNIQFPESVPLVGGVKLGDLLLGQAPEEVNNWSYGNAPMQIVGGGTGSLMPQTKTGRQQPLADALVGFSGAPGVGKLARKLPGAALSAMEDVAAHSPGAYGQRGMIAWHGSPHQFDRFDMSKIGTGEGAQAYGHGLYVAENPGVANEYAAKLGKPEVIFDGKTVEQLSVSDEAKNLARWIRSRAGSMQYGAQHKTAREDFARLPKEIQEELKSVDLFDGGILYKTDIPDEAVDRMLDWDKPLSQQPENVKKFFHSKLTSDGIKTDPPGSSLHQSLLGLYDHPSLASEMMSDAGIKGIRYLDGGSRGSGSGSSNFVLFDDQMPRIIERNGQPTGAKPWAPGEWQTLSALSKAGK